MKRLIPLLVAAALLAASCNGSGGNASSSAGSSAQNGPSAAETPTVALPFTEKDSLNPYKAKSKNNRELCLLLYDTPVTVNDRFEPEYALAESVEVRGKTLTVKIKPARFSDGSAVTAEDAVYSLKLAQKSKTDFASRLAGVASANAASASVFTVTLKKPNPNAAALLDFPVIKRNTDKSDTEPPVGGGRYVFRKNGNQPELAANETFRDGKPGIERIALVSTPDSTSLEHRIASGGISMYYSDLSDGKFPTMNGTAFAVPLNNLVFLAAGPEGPAADAAVRRAVSAAADRGALAKDAFRGYARAASGIFHPAWERGRAEWTMFPEKPDSQIAVEELAKTGYNKKDSAGYFVKDGRRLTLRLAVNKENAARVAAANLIRNRLKKCGIEVRVQALSRAAYRKAAETGDYDLLLAEMRLSVDMDLSPLLLEGAVAEHLPEESAAAAAYEDFLSGKGTLEDFLTSFAEEMPVIPLCYRDGILISDPLLGHSLTPGVSDIFYKLEKIRFS